MAQAPSLRLQEEDIMERSVKSPQTRMRVLHFTLTTTGTPAVSGLDKNQIDSVVDNGTGDVTVIFKRPFSLVPICLASSQGSTLQCVGVKAKDTDRVTIKIQSMPTDLVAGAAADGVVDVYVAGKDDIFYR
jgi:hypothetical protein